MKWNWIDTELHSRGRAWRICLLYFLFFFFFFFLNMPTYQAEVRLGWQLMWNFKCNKICWLWQLTPPAAAPHIQMHTQSNTHICTLNPRCLQLTKSCSGSRNLTRAQLDTSSSLFLSVVHHVSLKGGYTIKQCTAANSVCVCVYGWGVCVHFFQGFHSYSPSLI